MVKWIEKDEMGEMGERVKWLDRLIFFFFSI
jgi:hypothetical protein